MGIPSLSAYSPQHHAAGTPQPLTFLFTGAKSWMWSCILSWCDGNIYAGSTLQHSASAAAATVLQPWFEGLAGYFAM